MLLEAFKKIIPCNYSILLAREEITTETGSTVGKILSSVKLDGIFSNEAANYFSKCFNYQNCSDFLSRFTSGHPSEIAFQQQVMSMWGEKLPTCIPEILHSVAYPTYITHFICNDERINTILNVGKVVAAAGVTVTGLYLLWDRYSTKPEVTPDEDFNIRRRKTR